MSRYAAAYRRVKVTGVRSNRLWRYAQLAFINWPAPPRKSYSLTVAGYEPIGDRVARPAVRSSRCDTRRGGSPTAFPEDD